MKLYKAHYNEGCKKFYDGYDIDPEGRHAFVTALIFKVKRFGWGRDSCGILDIPTDDFTNLGGTVHKYLLEPDGEFSLIFLKGCVGTYINVPVREAQDDTMLFEAVINSLFLDGKCKIYNRSNNFHTLGKESGILLIKTILDKSGLQTHVTVMKEKYVLENLLELMVRLIHNVSKFNSRFISTSLNLKRNGSSAPDLLHQLFPAYLVCPDKQFHDYNRAKQDKFEEGLEMRPDYLMKYTRFK